MPYGDPYYMDPRDGEVETVEQILERSGLRQDADAIWWRDLEARGDGHERIGTADEALAWGRARTQRP